MKNLLGILLLTILSGCSFESGDGVEPTKIEVVGDTLFFEGGLNDETITQAMSQVQNRSIKRLNLRSFGGDIIPSIKFARWIRDNKVDVEINEICFSSCANYLFPAGINKYISEKDLIGWHGGAYQVTFDTMQFDDPEAKKALELYMTESRKMETELYQYLGVNPKLPTMGQEDAYRCQKNGEQGWYYSVSDLNKLGVDNIVLTDGQWNPALYHSNLCQVILPM